MSFNRNGALRMIVFVRLNMLFHGRPWESQMDRDPAKSGDRRENAQAPRPRPDQREDGTNLKPRGGRRQYAHNSQPRGGCRENGKPSQMRGGHREGSSPSDGGFRGGPSHFPSSHSSAGSWPQQWGGWRYGRCSAGKDSET